MIITENLLKTSVALRRTGHFIYKRRLHKGSRQRLLRICLLRIQTFIVLLFLLQSVRRINHKRYMKRTTKKVISLSLSDPSAKITGPMPKNVIRRNTAIKRMSTMTFMLFKFSSPLSLSFL